MAVIWFDEIFFKILQRLHKVHDGVQSQALLDRGRGENGRKLEGID